MKVPDAHTADSNALSLSLGNAALLASTGKDSRSAPGERPMGKMLAVLGCLISVVVHTE